MDLRDRSGGITPAEGCMFLAMLLFAGLLITLLVLAVFRFQDRPTADEVRDPVTSYHIPAARYPELVAGSGQRVALRAVDA